MLDGSLRGGQLQVVVEAAPGELLELLVVRAGHVHVDVVVPGDVALVPHRPQQRAARQVVDQPVGVAVLRQRVQHLDLQPPELLHADLSPQPRGFHFPRVNHHVPDLLCVRIAYGGIIAYLGGIVEAGYILEFPYEEGIRKRSGEGR